MQVCTSLQTDNHASTPPFSFFTGRMPFLLPNQQRQCTEGTTHTRLHAFNGPLSGTTQVSRYQKGKTNLDFTEARDSAWQWHVCTLLQADNHASTPPVSFFTGRMPFLLPNQRHQSTEGTEYLEVILGTCLQPSFSIVFARGSKQLKVYSTL